MKMKFISCWLQQYYYYVAACLLLIFISASVKAQYNIKENNHWIFGYKAGIDFSSGTPVVTAPTSFVTGLGSATVSDANGDLLFYTSGHDVWDKNGTLMPNGNDIFPIIGRLSPFSGKQGALIVPVIGNSEQYYVFSLESTSKSAFESASGGDTAVSRFFYSIVDMSLNNGLGDIVPGKKGIPLDSSLSGNMIAIQGDRCNIWVLTHAYNKPIFKAWEVTTAGINTQPVLSTAGNLTSIYAYCESGMRISPNRHKLSLSSRGRGFQGNGVELYDFDPLTGMASNAIAVENSAMAGCAAFSPDNSKLYVSGQYSPTYVMNFCQYDISLATPAAIQASKYIIPSKTQYLDVRLGPDGKIYNIRTVNFDTIGCVNDPNLAGAACDYNPSVLFGPPAFPLGYQFLQNFPNEYVKATPIGNSYYTSLDTSVCPGGYSIPLTAPSGAYTYQWDDGTTAGTRTVSAPGKYYVVASSFCATRVDTFIVEELVLQPVVITVNGFVLGTTGSYTSYKWYLDGVVIPNATNATLTVTKNGKYTVEVTNSNGCTDSASYTVTNVSVNNIPQTANVISIYPNPSNSIVYIQTVSPVNATLSSIDGKVVLQQNNASQINISDLAAGVYLLRLTTQDGQMLKVEKLIKKDF